jgi:YidC/Oxa1 family membrane protein insertase
MTAFLGKILGSLLKFVYDLVANIGTEPENFSYFAIAIIITTIIFKLLLLPLNMQQMKSTKKMSEIQPELKSIQKKYKNDPQTQQIKLQELYKKHNYNPAAGCFPMLIQFPIIIAFFAVFREPAKYAFTNPAMYESMNKAFLWIPNLENPDPYMWGLPLLAAITTYGLNKTMQPPNVGDGNDAAASTQKTMSIFLPILIFFSARSFAAGLALYWVIGNIFTIVQQIIMKRPSLKVKEEK